MIITSRDFGLAKRFKEYLKLKEFIKLKVDLVSGTPPPMYLKNYDWKNLGKFGVILIEPALEAGEKKTDDCS